MKMLHHSFDSTIDHYMREITTSSIYPVLVYGIATKQYSSNSPNHGYYRCNQELPLNIVTNENMSLSYKSGKAENGYKVMQIKT